MLQVAPGALAGLDASRLLETFGLLCHFWSFGGLLIGVVAVVVVVVVVPASPRQVRPTSTTTGFDEPPPSRTPATLWPPGRHPKGRASSTWLTCQAATSGQTAEIGARRGRPPSGGLRENNKATQTICGLPAGPRPPLMFHLRLLVKCDDRRDWRNMPADIKKRRQSFTVGFWSLQIAICN